MATCRCPICGDSTKNKFKTRFYFLEDKNHFRVYCHNCNYSSAFGHFLNKFDTNLYDQYKKEVFKEKLNTGFHKKIEYTPDITIKNPIFSSTNSPINDLIRVDRLGKNHVAVQYLDKRQIPQDKYDRLYYTDNFQKWVNTFVPEKYTHISDSDERVVFPYIWNDNFFGCAGRTISNSNIRYFIISLDYEKKLPHLYGMCYTNFQIPYYVVEGQIDSLFLDNCVALGTNNIDFNSWDFSNAIFILDNEPRNLDVVRSTLKIINAGYNIVIWPKFLREKDLNDMKIAGIDYKNIIDNNIYNSLTAMTKFQEWKKVTI